MSKQCTMILSDHITDAEPIDAEPTDAEVAQDIEAFRKESIEFQTRSNSCIKDLKEILTHAHPGQGPLEGEERDELRKEILTEDKKINEKINKLSDKLGCCVLPVVR